MTHSSLCDSVILSPNLYEPRAYNITRLTPHHTASIMTAAEIAKLFSSASREASCNYAIGYDGSICCVVEEENGAWTSASWDNDNRAITFEISDCDYDWNISDAAKEAYINLCVDLIQRYPSLGGSYNWTGDLNGNVTVHRWFAATACPGDPLYNMQEELAAEINRRLAGGGEDEEVQQADIDAIISGVTNAMALIGEPFNNEGLYYQAHVANEGWAANVRDGQIAGTTGKGRAVEAIKIMPPAGVDMTVSAHLAGIGWQDYSIPSAGAIVGTTGEQRAIEAIKITCNKPVKYRAHVANEGWQEWRTNDQEAGTTGKSQAIEAIQIMMA